MRQQPNDRGENASRIKKKTLKSYVAKLSPTHQRLKIHAQKQNLGTFTRIKSAQKGRNHRKRSKRQADGAGAELTSQPRPPASAKQLTSEKSGIVTSSRSRGRPLPLAALLKKLATEPQVSCWTTRGRDTTTEETEWLQPSKVPQNGNVGHVDKVFKNRPQQNVNGFSNKYGCNGSCMQAPHACQSQTPLEILINLEGSYKAGLSP